MQRKKMIISEIEYWKSSKLLPEHYCDFLIALYSEGSEIDGKEKLGYKSVLHKENKNTYKGILLLILLTIFCTTILFVFNNYPIITWSVAILFICSFLMYAMQRAVTQSALIPFMYIASAFMLLAMSLKLWMAFFQGENMILIGLLSLNCMLWLFTGRLLNLLYFTISGSAGLLLIIGFLLV